MHTCIHFKSVTYLEFRRVLNFRRRAELADDIVRRTRQTLY